MPVREAVVLRRPRVPALEVKERFQPGIGDGERFDAVLLDGHQPHGDAVGRVPQVAVEVSLQHLTIDEPDRDLAALVPPFCRCGRPGREGDPLDRGQWHERALVVSGVIAQIELQVWLLQADLAHTPLHDLVIKKSDGDSGRFSGLGTAQFMALAVMNGRIGTERQRHYNGAISKLLRKNRGCVTKLENASESRAPSARTGAIIRPRLGGRDLTSNDFAESGWYSG